MLPFVADILCHLRAQKNMVFGLIFVASLLVKVDSYSQSFDHVGNSSQALIGCWPCFQAYLASSYFNQHGSLLDSDFHDYLAHEFGSNEFCEGLASEGSTLGLSGIQRQLSGEGSHRHLISTLRFNQSDVRSLLDAQHCEAVIIERLPIGVFADPFELQHLVHRKVFLDVAVFGDTNLELPSALSNRSIVEIHMNISLENPLRGFETAIELPLHARYPPLDDSGYAKVEFRQPDLFLRCRPKGLQSEPCSWMLIQLNTGSAKSVMWRIPAGNDAHRGIVSRATFVSALFCALSIVVSALPFSRNNDVRGSR